MRVPSPFILLPLTAVLIGFLLAGERSPRDEAESLAPLGLPVVAEYGSLLVGESAFLLGTERGIFRSRDEGTTWTVAALDGDDARLLARAPSGELWAGGRGLLARSADGGATWRRVRPRGLPRPLDVEALAAGPNGVYVFVRRVGLFRSSDVGRSFRRVGKLGGSVRALDVTHIRLLAAERLRGVLLESVNGGRTWRPLLEAELTALASHPDDELRIVAAGRTLLLTEDGGLTWREVLATSGGVSAVAWTSTAAYAVSLDGQLYRSDDLGRTWFVAG